MHSAILSVGILLGLLAWYIAKPPSVRFYETKSEQPLAVTIAPAITMVLDIESSVATKDSEPLQIELFKGNVYFDVKENAADKIEVKVGQALIKDGGTRFSIRVHKDGGGHVAVANGQIRIHVTSGVYQVNTHEQVDFDDTRISQHKLIAEHDIAPWRTGQP